MGEQLTTAGISFEPHRKHFEHDAPDEVWLRFAGSRGWPVLARDKHFRSRPNEFAAYVEGGVLGFIFTAGDLSGVETARLTQLAYPTMATIASTVPRPPIFSIDRQGAVSPLQPAGRIRL